MKEIISVQIKHIKKSFKQINGELESNLIELVHSGLIDFRNYNSRGGKNYCISFVFSRYTKIYLFKIKDEVESEFLKYKDKVENQLDLRIKSNYGGEYDTKSFIECYDEFGISMN